MSDAGNGNTLIYRVNIIERELEKLENRTDTNLTELRTQIVLLSREVAVFHEQFSAHVKASGERLDQLEGSVNEDVKGLRKVLLSVGAAVLIAAITFAITSLAVFGGPG